MAKGSTASFVNVFAATEATVWSPACDFEQEPAAPEPDFEQAFMAHIVPHMMRQGASAMSIGAMPAATSQGQPLQRAGMPKATAAAIRPRQPRSW